MFRGDRTTTRHFFDPFLLLPAGLTDPELAGAVRFLKVEDRLGGLPEHCRTAA